MIEGGKIDQYLLEKSRIVVQAQEERNYHIFYCMLVGLGKEEKSKLELQDASSYFYLTQGGCTECEGRDDREEYSHIMDAMRVLSFSQHEIFDVHKILAALLHLGNIKFKGKSYHFALLSSITMFSSCNVRNYVIHFEMIFEKIFSL